MNKEISTDNSLILLKLISIMNVNVFFQICFLGS